MLEITSGISVNITKEQIKSNSEKTKKRKNLVEDKNVWHIALCP